MLKMSGVTPIELELRYDSKKSLEDTKEVIRIGKSKKGTQHNGKKKRTNNNLQNTTQKTKDRVTRIPIKNPRRTQVLLKDKQFMLH